MYDDAKACVWTMGSDSERFQVPWCMLFAGGIVLIDETRGGLNTRLEERKSQEHGSVFQGNGEIDEDVTHRIGAGLSLLYEAKCWSIENSHAQKMQATEIRLFGQVRSGSEVQDKMWKVSLRWFEHVRRRGANVMIRRCDWLVIVA
ncbi:hypothetical protein H5410_059022 [Solanum commersonii]|uniref:Uncharacterized protein n=1 Tax=Solanum commersonii TaxID=4109 RepID=A0A9J5W1N2_SOLCO|nr:hypothetical protein H5410_059022 [Solanum commersonii]